MLPEWPKEGPPLLWKIADLGAGYSPVSVVGSRAYTLAFRGAEEFVVALDAGTGKEVWTTSLGVSRENGAMAFLRQRQPLVDETRLYAFSTAGALVCLETDQGKELWTKRYAEDFKGRSSSFGWTDYPLLDGDRLICTPGGKDAFHVALDPASGEAIWKSKGENGLGPSHSPIMTCQAGGVRQYVQTLHGGLVGIAAADGKILWRNSEISNGTANMAAAIVDGDQIFASSGYGKGCTLLKVTKNDDGMAAQPFYFQPKFESLYGGMVPWGGYVYAGNSPTFGLANPCCVNVKTGKIEWEQKGLAKGAVATIAADNRLYFRFADGVTILVETTPEGFKEKGRLVPAERSKQPVWSVPVLANGRLFLRDQELLCCYDLRPPKPRIVPALEKEKDISRQPDAVFIPTPPQVVDRMLSMAKVNANDVVYDLGCGDGRIPIAAARSYKARGVGVEIDGDLVRQAREQIERDGLRDLITIREEDLFTTDFRDATVVALYLLPHLQAKLLPQFANLKPGSRIVSHAFPIPGMAPDRIERLTSEEGLKEHVVYLYAAPLRPTPAIVAWPRFRGPNGAGINDDSEIPAKWTPGHILWKTPIPGKGISSPVIWENLLFLQSAPADGLSRELHCVDTSNGKIRWTRATPANPGRVQVHQMNSLASGTPALDGQRVYVPFWLGQSVSLAAFDFRGQEIWRRDLGACVGGEGAPQSPIVQDGRVVYSINQNGASVLLALDAATGADVWSRKRPLGGPNYATPLLCSGPDGKPAVAAASAAGLAGYRFVDGEDLWAFSLGGNNHRPAGSPILSRGMIFGGCSEPDGKRVGVAVKLNHEKGRHLSEMLWKEAAWLPHIPTVLASGDRIYFVNEQGHAGCVNAKTGEMIWRERLEGQFYSSPVMARGRIFAPNAAGKVFVFEASDTYRPLAAYSLDEKTVASPAIAGGRIFIRGAQHLFCIGNPAVE